MLMERSSLDADQLATFDRIVREGGFGRAAVALGLGQPAVSARIRALEAAVGGTLFTRGRQVALTALGESFLPYARRALEVLGEGVEVARRAGARWSSRPLSPAAAALVESLRLEARRQGLLAPEGATGGDRRARRPGGQRRHRGAKP